MNVGHPWDRPVSRQSFRAKDDTRDIRGTAEDRDAEQDNRAFLPEEHSHRIGPELTISDYKEIAMGFIDGFIAAQSANAGVGCRCSVFDLRRDAVSVPAAFHRRLQEPASSLAQE